MLQFALRAFRPIHPDKFHQLMHGSRTRCSRQLLPVKEQMVLIDSVGQQALHGASGSLLASPLGGLRGLVLLCIRASASTIR